MLQVNNKEIYYVLVHSTNPIIVILISEHFFCFKYFILSWVKLMNSSASLDYKSGDPGNNSMSFFQKITSGKKNFNKYSELIYNQMELKQII